MTEQVRVIRLYGKLGTRFGRVHRYVVDSPAAAVRALCSMVPGFERELMESKDAGITFAVFIGQRNVGEEQLSMPAGQDEIRIAPVLQGSKSGGVFQTILGAAIVAIAYFNPGGFLTGPMVTAAYGIGSSMFLGGVMQLLSPQQRGLSTADSADNGASYNFNGPVNTQAQGNAIPVLYGRMLVGSAVISGGIYAQDQQ